MYACRNICFSLNEAQIEIHVSVKQNKPTHLQLASLKYTSHLYIGNEEYICVSVFLRLKCMNGIIKLSLDK